MIAPLNLPDDTPESDDELLRRTREGDRYAYGALWRRHASAAYSVARTFRSSDADDLVSEAFTRVMEVLDAGDGPRAAFRPYLTMVVRNLGRYDFDRRRTAAEREAEAQGEVTVPSAEDVHVDAFERTAAASAFLSLPRRWQQALWYSEIDGLKPRVVSEYIGISPNAVSALTRRAKRAFRDAWVTEQLGKATSAECSWALTMMGAHTRRALSPRVRMKLEAHLCRCPTCPAAMQEASRLFFLTLAGSR